ncbi:hypothetical protein LINPERPRIM_LOCUS40370 [Linum perenne]
MASYRRLDQAISL